ncbi:MAG: DNA-3-methyladenine glycosylase [bacterium]
MITPCFSSLFFEQSALKLAEELLGHFLIRKINGKKIKAMIVETEAYCGAIDKASHAFNNKRTKRTEPMFLQGGHSYIYLIYGLNYCFNVVAEKEGNPEAVLIRAVEPVEGLDIIKQNRPEIDKLENLTNGPGKLAKALSIDISLNGCNLINGKELYIEKNLKKPIFSIVSAKRIGIDYAEEFKDKLWRKYIEGNTFVSKKI